MSLHTSRQQATINRQNETIETLERELKVFKMDDMRNPYSIDRVTLTKMHMLLK